MRAKGVQISFIQSLKTPQSTHTLPQQMYFIDAGIPAKFIALSHLPFPQYNQWSQLFTFQSFPKEHSAPH